MDYTEPSDDTIDLEEFSHALLHEEGREMAVKLNESAFEHAKRLISEEKVEIDERDAWSEHQPSTEEENKFIHRHGYEEYAKWHLGIDEETDQTKKDISFPSPAWDDRCTEVVPRRMITAES